MAIGNCSFILNSELDTVMFSLSPLLSCPLCTMLPLPTTGSTTHYVCGSYKGRPWCGTSLKEDGSYSTWEYCGDGCPKDGEALSTVVDDWQTRPT